MLRKSQALTLLLIVILALAGCGGQAAPPAGSGQAGATGSSPQPDLPKATSQPQAAETPTADPNAEPDPARLSTVEPSAGENSLVIYSGRSAELVGPLLEQFAQDTGIEVQVKYGDTAELAAVLLEEGEASPADIFFAQDAGALGALSSAGRFAPLDDNSLVRVAERFRAEDGSWVGVSGRARVAVYNPTLVEESSLPDTIFGFTDPRWQGKIGWAPTNGSFQAFVTALRVLMGDEQARQWLEAMQANQPKVYPSNSSIVQAVANGEVEVGFVNHYYLFRFLAEKGESFPARNYYFKNGDPGALVNVAGVGVLKSSSRQELAQQFVRYLLEAKAQRYFSAETYEYPLVQGIEADPGIPALSEIRTPQIDLSDLEDLEGTLRLLQDAGIL